MIKRTICCSLCNNTLTEAQPNEGFPGWGGLLGISLDGQDNPSLCPQHLAMLADFIDEIKNGKQIIQLHRGGM